MFIRTPNSPAESLAFIEENGMALVLNERFLPYRPITIGGKQRAEFTWYPGSPEATVQMLGPEEDSIQLKGFWKDKFYGENSVSYGPAEEYNNRVNLGFAFYGDRVANVAALVQAVDNMRRMGRRITLKWSGLLRVGHITGFRQTWHNIHDCEWEIDFSVVSQGEQTVPSVTAVTITLPDLYQQALRLAVEIQDAIIEASRVQAAVTLSNQASQAFNAAELLIQATAGALFDVASGYANSVFTVTQGTRRAIATLSGAIANTAVLTASIGRQALSELFSFGNYGEQDNAPLGIQLAADSVRRTVTRDFRRARYAFAFNRSQAAQQATGQAADVRTYVAPADIDLRTVSQVFYGTSDNWRALMLYNGRTESELNAGDIIFIPPVSVLTAQDSGGGRT